LKENHGYLFYDLLGFKADPTKVSNKSYIASRDPSVESLRPLATNEIWDETIWRRKVRNIFAKKFLRNSLTNVSFLNRYIPRSLFYKRIAQKSQLSHCSFDSFKN